MSDAPLDRCLCGATGTVKSIIQPTGIMFKGSGFYVNDSQPTAAGGTSESVAASCTGTPGACPACSD